MAMVIRIQNPFQLFPLGRRRTLQRQPSAQQVQKSFARSLTFGGVHVPRQLVRVHTLLPLLGHELLPFPS